MVKVEIVEEKEVVNSPYASPSSSRTNSTDSLSSIASDVSVEESLFDRVAALVDIVPPTTRHSISSKISKTASFIKKGGKVAGNIVWIVTTSALLVALPLALSLEDEAKIVAQEKEMLEQQQGAQQVRSCPCDTCQPASVVSGHSFPGQLHPNCVLPTDARAFHVSTKFHPTTTKSPCAAWLLDSVLDLTIMTRYVRLITSHVLQLPCSLTPVVWP